MSDDYLLWYRFYSERLGVWIVQDDCGRFARLKVYLADEFVRLQKCGWALVRRDERLINFACFDFVDTPPVYELGYCITEGDCQERDVRRLFESHKVLRHPNFQPTSPLPKLPLASAQGDAPQQEGESCQKESNEKERKVGVSP